MSLFSFLDQQLFCFMLWTFCTKPIFIEHCFFLWSNLLPHSPFLLQTSEKYIYFKTKVLPKFWPTPPPPHVYAYTPGGLGQAQTQGCVSSCVTSRKLPPGMCDVAMLHIFTIHSGVFTSELAETIGVSACVWGAWSMYTLHESTGPGRESQYVCVTVLDLI